MAEEKDIVHTQVDSASGQTHLNETEEETDAVLLDVGLANLDSGAYSSLELAKDGHVWETPLRSLFEFRPNSIADMSYIDCTCTATIIRPSRSPQLAMAKETHNAPHCCVHSPFRSSTRLF